MILSIRPSCQLQFLATLCRKLRHFAGFVFGHKLHFSFRDFRARPLATFHVVRSGSAAPHLQSVSNSFVQLRIVSCPHLFPLYFCLPQLGRLAVGPQFQSAFENGGRTLLPTPTGRKFYAFFRKKPQYLRIILPFYAFSGRVGGPLNSQPLNPQPCVLHVAPL